MHKLREHLVTAEIAGVVGMVTIVFVRMSLLLGMLRR